MHIFDNDDFLIIPKSIFFDNNNLPISCKNADISAADNFFDNIAHPYVQLLFHESDMDSKGTISQYKKLWFYAFKEAEAIMGRTKLGLSSARDQILEEANENYRKILEKGNENYRKNIEETSTKYRIINPFGPSPKITEEKNAKYRKTKLLEQSPKLLEPTSNREVAHSILPFSAILVTACMITTHNDIISRHYNL